MLSKWVLNLAYRALLFGLVLVFFPGHAPLTAAPLEEGKRIALIIGNNNYGLSPLKNAVNDSRLMDKALQSAGFRTIHRENATQAVMQEATVEFLQQLGPDDTALFFYAGHGIQIENENFLVPVDFEAADSVIQAKFRCFSMAQFLELVKHRPKRSIIILDACRSNPVAQSQSLQAGLAQPQNAGKETYIAYSTGPGQVAADNPSGRDSWFTEALAELIQKEGLSIEEVFTGVRARVSTETDGRQTPWTTSSLTKKFYFHAPLDAQSEADAGLAEKWMLEAERREHLQDWPEAIRLVERILASKPGGALESAASAKLPYWSLLKDAEARYAASEFGAAAVLYEKAFRLDPFSVDTGFKGVDGYLLNDQLPQAVALLKEIRVRGTSTSVAKTDAMLKEVSGVYPPAQQILQAGIPQPPPIEELFKGMQLGAPDLYAGKRYLQTTPVPLARWIKDLEALSPPALLAKEGQGTQPSSSELMAAAQLIAKGLFHVEIGPIGESRDIAIRRIGEPGSSGSAPPLGRLLLDGPPGQTPVLFGGKPVAQQVPFEMALPAGKYEIRGIKDGKVVSRHEIEITASGTAKLLLERE